MQTKKKWHIGILTMSSNLNKIHLNSICATTCDHLCFTFNVFVMKSEALERQEKK